MAFSSTARFSRLSISWPSSSKSSSSAVRPSARSASHICCDSLGRNVGVVETVDQKQRRGHRVRPRQRGQLVEQIAIADRVAVLGVGRRRDPLFGVAVPGVQVAHPADADARREQVADETPAQPASDSRRRTSRSRRCVRGRRPLSTRNRTASATSSMAAKRRSRSSACMKERPNPPDPRTFGRNTLIPASSSGGKNSL